MRGHHRAEDQKSASDVASVVVFTSVIHRELAEMWL
jgi:hypothetical protein